jgi:hypothetical protein
MLQSFLRRGMEKQKLSFFLKEYLDTVDLALNEVYPAVRSTVLGGFLPREEKMDGLRTLDEFAARAGAIRDEWLAFQRWLDSPPPQVDAASLPSGGRSPELQGFEDLGDLIARLRAGGDL